MFLDPARDGCHQAKGSYCKEKYRFEKTKLKIIKFYGISFLYLFSFAEKGLLEDTHSF